MSSGYTGKHSTGPRSALGRWPVVAVLWLALFCSGAWAGTLRPFRYDSPALGKPQTAQIYLPAGEAPDDGWPVLYLLHGLHGTAQDWNTLGGIVPTLDRLIATRRIKPLVVVMPDGGQSWYVDSADVGGPGNYATAIGHDLPAAIEDAFPVGEDRQHRAIAGVSMGGYGALRLGLAAPERYAAIATLSPALWQNIPLPVPEPAAASPHDRAPAPPYFQRIDPDTVTIGIDLPPEGRHFGTAFGTPFDPRRFNEANVFTLLQQAVEAHKTLPAIYLSVGDDDSHRLWRGSIAFFETMQANSLDVDFRVTDGDHNWTLWRAALVDAILFADAHLGRPAVR